MCIIQVTEKSILGGILRKNSYVEEGPIIFSKLTGDFVELLCEQRESILFLTDS